MQKFTFQTFIVAIITKILVYNLEGQKLGKRESKSKKAERSCSFSKEN
jgi:hypothetical protein